jgi:hypothetical protein
MALLIVATPAARPSAIRAARAAARTAPAVAPTHEAFIHAVRTIAVDAAVERGRITADEAARLRDTKLVYGVGSHRGARGVCYYGKWQSPDGRTVDLVEIAAAVQESWAQLAGTTLHELAHVLRPMAGHNRDWSEGATLLGLGDIRKGPDGKAIVAKRPEAAGQRYTLSLFQPHLRAALVALVASMTDGHPAFASAMGLGLGAMLGPISRPCSAGNGTRGGTSRGIGSGSRIVLWQCACDRPAKVRAARGSGLDATCNRCGTVLAPEAKD